MIALFLKIYLTRKIIFRLLANHVTIVCDLQLQIISRLFTWYSLNASQNIYKCIALSHDWLGDWLVDWLHDWLTDVINYLIDCVIIYWTWFLLLEKLGLGSFSLCECFFAVKSCVYFFLLRSRVIKYILALSIFFRCFFARSFLVYQ